MTKITRKTTMTMKCYVCGGAIVDRVYAIDFGDRVDGGDDSNPRHIRCPKPARVQATGVPAAAAAPAPGPGDPCYVCGIGIAGPAYAVDDVGDQYHGLFPKRHVLCAPAPGARPMAVIDPNAPAPDSAPAPAPVPAPAPAPDFPVHLTPQTPPAANTFPAAWDLVITDMRERDRFGRSKYGTPLQPHNNRDSLYDAYQEALDLCVYLRNMIYERDGK